MKRCPVCGREYADDSMIYCLDDGSVLSVRYDSAETLINPPVRITDARTEMLPPNSTPPVSSTADTVPYASPPVGGSVPARQPWPTYVIIALLALIAGGGLVAILTLRDTGRVAGDGSAPTPARVSPTATPATNPTPDSEQKETTSAPLANTPPASSKETAPSASGGTWFVILGSFAKSERARADQRRDYFLGKGWNSMVVDTDLYPGLADGLWAVVIGPSSQAEAKELAATLKGNGEQVYAKSGW